MAEARAGAGVREEILASVVDHLISVDVEIRWEDIVDVVTEEAKEEEGEALPVGAGEEPDIFELEGMSELELVLGLDGGGVNGGSLDGGGEMMPGGGWEGGHARGGLEVNHINSTTVDGSASTAAAVGGVNGGGVDQMLVAAAAATTTTAASVVVVAVDETADKLDSMMEMVMEHLQRRIAAGQLPSTWDTALAAFERTILHTHRSKFVQYLLFFLARHAPEQCCGSFVGFLLSRITDRLQPPITRSAAAAYAGSFLARAAFIPEPLVVEALQRLADWCVRYTREEDRRGGLPPIPSAAVLTSLGSADTRDRHAPFFAACQALLYALCYHMEPLLKRRARSAGSSGGGVNGVAAVAVNGVAAAVDENGTNGATPPPLEPPLLPHLQQHHHSTDDVLEGCAKAIKMLFIDSMPKLLTHALDPLSSCARSVVLEFGRQAGTLGHPELLRIVQEWERQRTSAAAAAAAVAATRSARPLEVFFPFDPYLLRRSAGQLELSRSYVRWRKGHPSGAPRAGLANGGGGGGGDDDMWDSEALLQGDSSSAEESDEDLTSSSDSSSDDDSDLNSNSSRGTSDSEDHSGSSESDGDGLRRTRFGSMPDSSLSSGGRGRGVLAGRKFGRRRLPGALKASLVHGGQGGSPTAGVPIPGQGSLSTDNGSPWGMSPTGGGYYRGSFAPMSMGDPRGD